MSRGKTIAAFALAVMLAAGSAMAQQQPPRILILPQYQQQPQLQPRLQQRLMRQQLRQQRQQQRLQQQQMQQDFQPRIQRMPPSQAAQIAQQMNPGAQLLKIRPNGNGYIAVMRQGNQVIRVPIPGN
jgi:hypothetical protein